MTDKMIDNRIRKIQAIEAQVKELEAQAESIRAELKADMEGKNLDEYNTGSFIVRWKEIVTARLDTKALKTALPDVFESFSKESRSRRFTIA